MPQINNSTTQHIVQPGIHQSDDNNKQHKNAARARFVHRQISAHEPTESVKATEIAKPAEAIVISKVPDFLLRQRKVEVTTPVSSPKVQQPVNVDKLQESGHQIRPERPLPKPPGDNSDNPTSHPVSKKSRPLPPPPGDNSDNPTSHPVSKNSRPLPAPPGDNSDNPTSRPVSKNSRPLPAPPGDNSDNPTSHPVSKNSRPLPAPPAPGKHNKPLSKKHRKPLPPLEQYKRPLPELPVDNSDQMPDESLTMVTSRSGNTLPTATTETWQAAESTGDDTLYQDIREQYAEQLADLEGTNDSGYQTQTIESEIAAEDLLGATELQSHCEKTNINTERSG